MGEGGGGGGVRAFNSVSGKIQVKMTERFNLLINTINKHIKMLKKKLIHQNVEVF